ncbi:hypothetical protein PTTG_27465 [Puccinia triticina 1-1 BBBD Race 1]|uniref:RING-type domain-containing protein n=1 Tax=Puccinia triticina (isolate 1-1 / race 1 (BBBD)) TaxID=630390 RepID=A0A180GKD4_PUCT1|nr:hypothetical protein PTTG_27465 [Puccinia triticina 1-1 BBBD Race 1]
MCDDHNPSVKRSVDPMSNLFATKLFVLLVFVTCLVDRRAVAAMEVLREEPAIRLEHGGENRMTEMAGFPSATRHHRTSNDEESAAMKPNSCVLSASAHHSTRGQFASHYSHQAPQAEEVELQSIVVDGSPAEREHGGRTSSSSSSSVSEINYSHTPSRNRFDDEGYSDYHSPPDLAEISRDNPRQIARPGWGESDPEVCAICAKGSVEDYDSPAEWISDCPRCECQHTFHLNCLAKSWSLGRDPPCPSCGGPLTGLSFSGHQVGGTEDAAQNIDHDGASSSWHSLSEIASPHHQHTEDHFTDFPPRSAEISRANPRQIARPGWGEPDLTDCIICSEGFVENASNPVDWISSCSTCRVAFHLVCSIARWSLSGFQFACPVCSRLLDGPSLSGHTFEEVEESLIHTSDRERAGSSWSSPLSDADSHPHQDRFDGEDDSDDSATQSTARALAENSQHIGTQTGDEVNADHGQCPICLERIVEHREDSTFFWASCAHAYHETCIVQFMNEGRTNCPMCRRTLSGREMLVSEHADEEVQELVHNRRFECCFHCLFGNPPRHLSASSISLWLLFFFCVGVLIQTLIKET